MVLLYPQATTSGLIPYNPKGCWDWWGYTGADYGKQFSSKSNSETFVCRNKIGSSNQHGTIYD
jgi:hypothetical protein